MKLKAPEGVGDPCVAGVLIAPRNGVYEVEPDVGALLIACFGFFEVEAAEKPLPANARRGRGPAKKPAAEA